MSTIMKALQRLEAQKQARKQTSLQEEIMLRPAQSGNAPRATALRIGAGVVVLACIATSVWFFGIRRKELGATGASSQQTVAESSAKPAPQTFAAKPTPPSFPEAAAMPTVEKNSFLENSGTANSAEESPSAKPTTPAFDRAEIRIPPKSVDSPRELEAAPSFRSALKAASTASRERAAPQPSAQNSAQSAPPQSPLVALIERKSESEAKPAEASALEAPKVAVEDKLPAAHLETNAETGVGTAPTETPTFETQTSETLPTAPTAATQALPQTSVESVASAAAVSEPTPKSDVSETPVMKIENAGIPEFRIRRTIWHPQPERRIAVVELLATKEIINLTEGDALGPLAVKEIKPSRIVFLHGEIEVTRRVGDLP